MTTDRLQVVLLTGFFIVVFTVPLSGQQQFNIGVGSGAQSFLMNDEVGSNLNYSGKCIPVIVSFEIASAKRTHHLQLNYAAPELSNRYNERILEGMVGSIQYAYSRRIGFSEKLLSTFYLGPYFKLKGFVRTYDFQDKISYPSVITSDLFSSIGLRASTDSQLTDKDLLHLQMSFPLISYLINHEYNGTSTSDFLYLSHLFDYHFGLTWSRLLNAKLSWLLSYRFNYYYADRVNDVRYGNHFIMAGLKLKLN